MALRNWRQEHPALLQLYSQSLSRTGINSASLDLEGDAAGTSQAVGPSL